MDGGLRLPALHGWLLRSPLGRRAFAADPDNLDAERVLAMVRAFLATVSLVAIFFDPTEPTQYATAAYCLVAGFVAYSVALLLVLRMRRRVQPWVALLTHGIDILVAAALTLLTEGLTSPFFVYFTFVLLAAAYRWGLQEAILTALVSFVLLAVEAAVTLPGGSASLVEGRFELSQFVLRATWLLLLAVVVGFLAEQEKRRRSQSVVVARTLSRVQGERGLFHTLQAAADEIFRMFGGHHVRLAVHDITAARLFVWDAERASNDDAPALRVGEIDTSERDRYFFETPASEWLLRCRPAGARPRFDLVWLNEGGVRRAPFAGPPLPFASMVFDSIAAGTLKLGDDWHIRMFIVDPDKADPRVLLETIPTLLGHVAPAIYNAYLVGRLRSRASALERGRVARELHDGVVQSLIGIEMRLDAARQHAIERADRVACELAALQHLLRGEIVNVRDLMQKLTDIHVRPDQVVELLANVVDRFHRETGIAAQFTSELDEVNLSPRTCRELVRIVQEALTNIRRHSGARHTLVHLAAQNGRYFLQVDDDGRGLAFAGTRVHQELEPDWQGPRVIKERVRSIGGELTIESRPGRGTRLKVGVPKSPLRPHA